MPADLFMQYAANLSECDKYRYRLSRIWDNEKPRACFIMLNPSTADASIDDPTIRRCMSFARRWDCGGIEVLNLFAYRATDPDELGKTENPVGDDNDLFVRATVVRCDPVVVAWGTHGAFRGAGNRMLKYLRELGITPKCLGRTKFGFPKHPLYIPDAQQLEDLLQ